MPRRELLPVLGWALLSCASLLFSLRDYDAFQFGTWGDDARYAMLARSLLHDSEYGVHIGPQPLPVAYPFVFPLALAPFVARHPDQLDGGKVVSLAATLANIALLFWGWPSLCRLRSRWWALAAATSYGLSPHVLGLSHMVMSEPLFTTFALAALIAGERAAAAREPRFGWQLAVGVASVLAFYTRSIGVVVVATVGVRLLWRWRERCWKPLAQTAVGALLVVTPVVAATPVAMHDLLPWIYVSRLPGPLHQGSNAGTLYERITTGVHDYATFSLRDAIVAAGGGSREQEIGERLGFAELSTAINLTVAALVAAGAAWSFAGALAPSVVLFEIFYLIVVLVWHFRSARLLYPLIPFLSLQLVWGARLVAEAVLRLLAKPGGALRRRVPQALAVLLLLTLGGAGLRRALIVPPPSTQFTRDFRLGTEWLRQHAEPGAVVIAFEPIQVHLYSGHPVVSAEIIGSEDDLRDAVRRLDARYLLVAPELVWGADGTLHYDQKTATVLLPLAESLAARNQATLAYESPPRDMVRVYALDLNRAGG